MKTTNKFSRWLPFALLALLVFSAALRADAADDMKIATMERVDLYAGEVRVLSIRPVDKVALGNAKIVSTTILPNDQLLLLADAPGSTTLHIWLKDGREMQLAVQVAENDASRILSDVRTLIQPLIGLSAREVGGQVFIEGEVDPKVKPRVLAIVKSFPKVVDLTLESDMTMKKMVYLDVRIMEFKKNALERIGIAWAQSANGPAAGLRIGRFQPLAGPKHFANLGVDFTSKINLLVQDGDAVELAAPHLSTRSGGEATFLAGGQIPISSTNTTGQSNITFKDYGIKLSFKPVTDADNNVLIKVETEVSTIDPAVTIQDVPGFLTRRTSAEVNLRDGEPMALSGMIDTNISNTVNKVPLLGNIPVLGQLFRSTEFRNDRTEMIVFVEPKVVEVNRQDKRLIEETAARIEKKRDQLLQGNLVD